MSRRVFPSTVIVLGLCLAGAPLFASSHSKEPAGPDPEERILVGPLGYRPPGPLYMLSGKAFTSLDFIDAHHLLFTFHQSRLMRREENPGRNDNDQIIQAVTLSLPAGNVEASAEWRMHDRSRYLWNLGGGKFLVRQRNSYLVTDASLMTSLAGVFAAGDIRQHSAAQLVASAGDGASAAVAAMRYLTGGHKR